MRLSPPEILIEARAFLGEGTAWDSARRKLYWVDIFAGRLHTFDPLTRQDEFTELERWVTCVAPTRRGGLILGLQDGIATLEPGGTSLQYLARPEAALPGNRFNDGKCSPEGRFVAGTMDNAEQLASGALYSLEQGGKIRSLLADVSISNGLAWSPDHKTLYFIDTPTRQVKAFDYDTRSGGIANPRTTVRVPESLGWPDGMTSDAGGNLWVAMWGGAAVTVWNPVNGALLEKIEFPAKNVTCCAFGGGQLNELYVTSARKGLGADELGAYPASGSLFRLQTNVTGMPTFVFND